MSRPRVLLYSADSAGLGHLRRTLLLAGEVARRRPDAVQLVASGSPAADAFAAAAAIPGLDVLRVPDAGKARLFADVPGDPVLGIPWAGVWTLRGAVLAAAARTFAPRLVHLDQAPTGHAGELAAAVAFWRSLPAGNRPRLVLGLRDIPAEPWDPARSWRRDGGDAVVEEAIDRILIYGDPRVYDTAAAYGLSPAARAKTVVCGYLAPWPPTQPAAEVRRALGVGAEPLAVAVAGGGDAGDPLLRAVLAALRDPVLSGVRGHVVAGPLLDPRRAAGLAEQAAATPGVSFARSSPDPVGLLAAADAAVTMGGANTVAEAVAVGKRPIVVPLVGTKRPTSEQLVRAERFAALGLATLLHPRDLTPARLAQTIRAELDAGASPPPLLDFGGLERAGAVLAALLED